ncbi:MAG: VCBS repeat-containing protein, partial [Acidobacteria bacterium]
MTDHDSPGLTRLWLGALAVIDGLLLNKWSVERLVAADEHIASWRSIALIGAGQLALIAAGAGLILGHRRGWRLPSRHLLHGMLAVVVAGFAFGGYGSLRALGVVDPYREVRAAWDELAASEDLLLELAPALQRLSRSARDLELPDRDAAELFAARVILADLPAGAAGEVRTLPSLATTLRSWQGGGEERTVARDELSLWRPLFSAVAYLEQAKLAAVDGRFVDPARQLFDADLRFNGTARLRTGGWQGIEIDQKVRWQRQGDAWRIVAWHTRGLRLQEAPRRYFEDVLDAALPQLEARQRARRSLHEERVRRFLLDPAAISREYPYFMPPSVDRHPGIAVTDVDGDGWDDVYAMERWGRNLLLHNRGDGSFEERSADFGLDLENHSSSAIFADFDNDGDRDVFVGRTRVPSLYLVNEGGRFVDRSATHVDGLLPCLASAVSAADYDGDGLLDVYVATYESGVLSAGLERDLADLESACKTAADLSSWRRRVTASSQHPIFDQVGPPNVLLHNLGGGRFAVVDDTPLRVFRQTFQATWADVDGDGDPDLYLANDYAPNNLFRNDGGGRFTDVTAETNSADVLGFSMGASWGDYDRDGRQDL